MPIHTFIGLAILIVALMVASVPQLLEPTAAGVERLAIQAGALDKPKPAAAPEEDAPTGDGRADGVVALRGRVLEADGDLRDTLELEQRAAAGTHRLARGTQRRLLPGQLERDRTPPSSVEDGVLLDATGCPVLRPGTDVDALLAVPENEARYQGKVAQADDAAACGDTFAERVAEARTQPQPPLLGASVARDRAAIRRGGAVAMLVAMREIELLADLMTDEELRAAVAAVQ